MLLHVDHYGRYYVRTLQHSNEHCIHIWIFVRILREVSLKYLCIICHFWHVSIQILVG